MKSYGANKTLEIPRNAEISSLIQIMDLYDRPVKKILKNLLRLQQTWIDNEGLQGIQRSKDLLFLWNKWVGEGSKPELIPPLRHSHGLLSKLQYAMRIVVKREFGIELINLISTVLRFHQSFGVTDKVISQLTRKSYETITKDYDDRPLVFGLYEQIGFIYGKGLDEQQYAAYLAAKDLADFLNRAFDLDKTNVKHDIERAFSFLYDTLLSLELERAEKLTKAGPHLWRPPMSNSWVSLKSILSEPLDSIAMENTKTRITRHLVRLDDGSISIRHYEPDETVGNVIDKINRFYLEIPHSGTIGLSYASRVSTGLPIPEFIKPRIGQIVPIKDKAGKIRNIAMTCYTVNKTLGPLHRWMFDILSKLPCDSTKQSKGIERMLIATSQHEACESKDLSSATDRLPLIVQRRILESLLQYSANLSGQQAALLATYWYILIRSLKFTTPDGDTLYYSVGQPMGVYTSWPMLALTNHMIACAAACSVFSGQFGRNSDKMRKEMKIFIQSGYQVCGDDIVIYNKPVAEKYHSMMVSFGVGINRQKSFSTEKNASISTAEFCKKLVVNGNIVSGQSLKVVLRALGIDDRLRKQPLLFTSMLYVLKELKAGSVLSKRQLGVIANSYPRALHHIPLEFGGLGFPNGSPCCQVLSQDAFILFYYYSKTRSMLKVFNESELMHQDDRPSPGSFTKQMELVPIIAPLSTYPDNPHRMYDLDYRQLSNREWFLDKSDKHNMLSRLLSCNHIIETWINDPSVIDEASISDVIDIVDTVDQCRRDLIKNRFTVAARPTDDADGVDPESVDSARTALKAIRLIRSAKRTNSAILDPSLTAVRSVLVFFAEYALASCERG